MNISQNNFKGDIKIMVIDDNLKNLQITGKILLDEGYQVSLAENGETALNMLNQDQYELILLDVMMPGIDGFEVCRQLKSNTTLKNIPVIFLTAKNNSEDVVEGFRVGGVDYINKPFQMEELLMRVKTHLELALNRKKIIELNKTRDKLYSIIAHDIRSPFNTIIGLIEAIDDGNIKPESAFFSNFLKELRKNTFKTSNLINNLLEWTKLQGENIEIKPCFVPISVVVKDCISLLKTSAEAKNISIEDNVDNNIEAYCDEISIHTVLRNLLSNAIKFTPENGRIEFNCSCSRDWVTIHVKDSGVGMSEEAIKKVLHEQGHYTTVGTKNEKGSGLGLYFIKDFIEKNNGELLIESKPDEGSTFSVKLPVQ